MKAAKKAATKIARKPAKTKPTAALPQPVPDVLKTLQAMGTTATREGMSRYGIVAKRAFGVTVGELRRFAKKLGRDHKLAAALWEADWFEARMLACLVEEPTAVTPAQMNRWARDFDNWAICDTACFHLFDKTPYAFEKVHEWAGKPQEFVKRASFALLASLTVHAKQADDETFIACLPLIERAATDERNFVSKAVNWALRSLGKRNQTLHAAALELARRLAASKSAAPRWVGKDAVRELEGATVARRLAAVKSRAARRS